MDEPSGTQGVPLRDVLALPTLRSCTVAAGAAHLDRPVRWVHCSDLPDIAYWLRGGELLIHTGVQNTGTSLLHLVRELHGANVAAVAIALAPDDLPRDVVALAESMGLPVISIPDEYRFVDITYEVGRLLLSADAMVSAKIEAFWSRVADQGLWTANMGRLLAAIAETVPGMPLALYDRYRKLITTYSAKGTPAGSGRELPAVLTPSVQEHFRLVPIEVGGGVNGYLVFPQEAGAAPGFDRLARHGARAIGLALDMSLRVDDLRARWKSDLFARILESSKDDFQDLELDARRAGLDLSRQYRVVAINAHAANAPLSHAMRQVAAEVTKQLGLAPIFRAFDEGCTLLLPAALRHEDLLRTIDGARTSLGAAGVQAAELRVGVGRSRSGLQGIAESAREAETAARAADGGEVAWYEELKVSRILLRGFTGSALLDDAASRLGPLSAREREHLDETVRALIETNFNASEAAKRLGLHRNGLRERIARLSAKVGCDLREAAEVTSMWLALQLKQQEDVGSAPGR